jgi:LysM repeat protein
MNKATLTLVIAIIALVLGIIGIYYGAGAKDLATKQGDDLVALKEEVQNNAKTLSGFNSNLSGLKNDLNATRSEIGGRLAMIDEAIYNITNKQVKVKGNAETGGGTAPVKPQRPCTYTTEKGDSLKSIAKKYGIKERLITDANPKLEVDKIAPGMKIKIP